MPLASWIVATHFRPALLEVALQSLRDQIYPDGWEHEILVAHHADDRHAEGIAARGGAIPVSTYDQTGGGKRTKALRAAKGDLVLVADDDDVQSPMRASAAIAAYDRGYAISEVREFRYLHLESGMVVRWCGRGGDLPAVTVGTARNFRRTLLERVGGWRPLPRLIEKDLQARISARYRGAAGARSLDLGTQLSDATICLQHGTNIWDDRPIVPKSKSIYRGNYRLLGEGHWTEAPNFPVAVADRLGLYG